MKNKKEENGIYAEFDLMNVPAEKYQVTGISNLCKLKSINKNDIISSRGEFAGFYTDDNNIYMFRDRIGARNIYYAVKERKAYISTDLSWIAKNINAGPNLEYLLCDYMQFQLPFSDDTFFKEIKKVMPGEIVLINKDSIKAEKYWDIKFGDSTFDVKVLKKLLYDAVEFRLSVIGNSSYTSYLSGGIDSSTVTLLATPDKCFSGFYEEEGYSEQDYIETVIKSSQNKKMEYVPVKITENNFYKYLKQLPGILPDPSCGLGIIPQVIVAEKAAAAGYVYSFTGEGGDEIFLGYNWNTAIFTLADAARGMLRDRYMVRYEGMVDKILTDGLATFTGGLLCRGDDLVYSTKRILDIWDRKQPVENNILKINLKIGLPAILSVDERVGYFSGIMPVSPIMDHKIVEYICSIRPQERALIPKGLFREAVKGILPDKVRLRYDKMGFPVPSHKWHWPMLKKAMDSLKKRNIIKVNPNDHKTMDRNTWALYSISSWYDYYIGNK